VKELWGSVRDRGKSMTDATAYSEELKRLFTDYEYTVRPVSEEQIKKVLA
jgi:hypothetical protein